MPRALRVARPVLAPLVLLLVLGGAPPAAASDGDDAVTLHVLGARVRPLKPDGKPWDGDHRRVPIFVYQTLSGVVGFPPLSALALVPYRNRPDPYVVVSAGETELGRSRPVQGSFLPTWPLEVVLPRDDLPTTLTFRIVDDDLRTDDAIGQAVVAVGELLERPGLHELEGSAGLQDVVVVVRRPGGREDGPDHRVTIQKVRVEARKRRPAGGDWDAGGNPLKGRLPKRIPLPEDLEGIEMAKPDLALAITWIGSPGRVSSPGKDAEVLEWSDVGLAATVRPGTGDGLVLVVRDADAAIDDPVGVIYVPLERLLASRAGGKLVLEPDESSGILRAEISFAVASP